MFIYPVFARGKPKTSVISLKRYDFVVAIVGILLVGILLGTALGPTPLREDRQDIVLSLADEKTVHMALPAVDSRGNPVVGTLETIVKPGSGRVLVNVGDILAQPDTQLSGRIAAHVARDYTNIILDNLDIIYNIDVNASVIEGPSAGAAMTLSIIFALQDVTPDPTVFITGSINSDGEIGPVGAIDVKAEAAKIYGATTLLIPKGQGADTQSERVRRCRFVNGRRECTVSYLNIDLREDASITIHEVGTVAEALPFFLDE